MNSPTKASLVTLSKIVISQDTSYSPSPILIFSLALVTISCNVYFADISVFLPNYNTHSIKKEIFAFLSLLLLRTWNITYYIECSVNIQ